MTRKGVSSSVVNSFARDPRIPGAHIGTRTVEDRAEPKTEAGVSIH
jgi:hypothetical protein